MDIEKTRRGRGNPGSPIFDWGSVDWTSPEYPGDGKMAKVIGCSPTTVRYHRLRSLAAEQSHA